MARQYGMYDDRDDNVEIDRTKLSMLSLFFGWLGSHRFYLGSDMAGAIYFVVFVLGLVLTLYEPIWITVLGFNINAAILIMLAPVVVSLIEAFALNRHTDQELYYKFHPTGESLTLVMVSQFIYLILLVIPAIFFRTS
jgi:TM2 domain-containing membrane protein YozV